MILLLSAFTLVVNTIALSAIVFRITEWGFTPNRTAVLGANVLMLIHLLLCTSQLIKVILKRAEMESVAGSMTRYLPVYLPWIVLVTFLFPVIFGFK